MGPLYFRKWKTILIVWQMKDDLNFLDIKDDPNFQDPQPKGWQPSTNGNSVCTVSDVCFWWFQALWLVEELNNDHAYENETDKEFDEDIGASWKWK